MHAPVAQLDRVSASEAEGWWFEPTRAREIIERDVIADHESYMRIALDLARKAGERGDVPVGAVVVSGGEVIGSGLNQKEIENDATAHAEIEALREASSKSGTWRLADATLYVTKEPCVMCAGACVAARIGRLVYACADPKGGGAGSVFDLTNSPRLNHRMTVEKGVLEEEAAEMLRAFFRGKRKRDDL